MNKFIKNSVSIIVALLLFNNSFAQIQSDRWIYVTQTAKVDKYYLGYEIVNETETTGSFWTKLLYANEKPKIDNILAKEKVSLVTFDFENKKYKTISTYYYDSKGEQLKSIEGDYDFKIIIPETIIESAYFLAKKIKYYAIELQNKRIDSLKYMISTGDSLYTSGALENSLQFFQYAKYLKEVIAKNKIKNKEDSDNENEQNNSDNQINLDDKITQIKEQIKTQKMFLSLMEKAKATMWTDPQLSIDYLEQANQIKNIKEITDKISELKGEIKTKKVNSLIEKANSVISTDPMLSIDYLEQANKISYSKGIDDKISEIKEGIKTKKVNSLIDEANSILPKDTLSGIEKLNEAYEISQSEELKNKISTLKEDYRIKKLHFYLESEKNKFIGTKHKLNFQDSVLTKNKLKGKEHLLEAYHNYYKYLLTKANSFTMVDNYFSTTTIVKTVDISEIDSSINNYNLEIVDMFNLQSYLLTLNQEDIKKLNKALKRVKTIDEIKGIIIFK